MRKKNMLGFLVTWLCVLALGVLPVCGAPGDAEKDRKPTAPRVQEGSLEEGKDVKEWKPGDPVRVMEDLREDADRKGQCRAKDRTIGPAAVQKPVAPQVMEKDLKELPKKKGYQPGEPVRVMPDLKEDGGKKDP